MLPKALLNKACFLPSANIFYDILGLLVSCSRIVVDKIVILHNTTVFRFIAILFYYTPLLLCLTRRLAHMLFCLSPQLQISAIYSALSKQHTAANNRVKARARVKRKISHSHKPCLSLRVCMRVVSQRARALREGLLASPRTSQCRPPCYKYLSYRGKDGASASAAFLLPFCIHSEVLRPSESSTICRICTRP